MICYKKCQKYATGAITVNDIGSFAHAECNRDEERLVLTAIAEWYLHYYYDERIIARNDNGIDDSSTGEREYEFVPEECIIDGGKPVGFFHGEIYLFADTSNHVKRTEKYEDGTGPLGGDVSTTTIVTFCERALDVGKVIGKRTSIKKGEFQLNKGIKEIRIPSHVTHIGMRAFLGCGLRSVDIPDNVTEMESGVFFSCENIKNVKIGAGLSVIPEECFQYCCNIETVKFSEGLRRIEKDAFAFAWNLRELELPDSTEELARDAFYRCDRLEYLTLPKGARVSRGTFRECGAVDIYFKGTPAEWECAQNGTTGKVYFYSESQPCEAGDYWYFENGKPKIWD